LENPKHFKIKQNQMKKGGRKYYFFHAASSLPFSFSPSTCSPSGLHVDDDGLVN